MKPVTQLPVEIWRHVVDMAEPRERARLSQVNTTLHQMARDADAFRCDDIVGALEQAPYRMKRESARDLLLQFKYSCFLERRTFQANRALKQCLDRRPAIRAQLRSYFHQSLPDERAALVGIRRHRYASVVPQHRKEALASMAQGAVLVGLFALNVILPPCFGMLVETLLLCLTKMKKGHGRDLLPTVTQNRDVWLRAQTVLSAVTVFYFALAYAACFVGAQAAMVATGIAILFRDVTMICGFFLRLGRGLGEIKEGRDAYANAPQTFHDEWRDAAGDRLTEAEVVAKAMAHEERETAQRHLSSLRASMWCFMPLDAASNS